MQIRLLFAVLFLISLSVTSISAEQVPVISPITSVTPIHATVTAYSSSRRQTDRYPTITASGKHVRSGFVACPRRFPFGTKVRIAGKLYCCEDRMNARFDDRFDIWKPSSAAARSFGKRELQVEVTEIPESTTETSDAR